MWVNNKEMITIVFPLVVLSEKISVGMAYTSLHSPPAVNSSLLTVTSSVYRLHSSQFISPYKFTTSSSVSLLPSLNSKIRRCRCGASSPRPPESGPPPGDEQDTNSDIKDDNLAKPFLTLFRLEDSEDTLVTAFDYQTGAKYLLESDPTPARIEEFGTGLFKGNLPLFYKSQAIPDNKDADILTVVGKTFDDLVLSSSKNILLEINTPWCLNCETTTKQVEKLAKHFKGLENLVFARIDASVNEHPKLEVDDYQTLLFYPISNKSNPITLPTKSSSKDLAKLINKHLKEQVHDEQHVAKEEL